MTAKDFLLGKITKPLRDADPMLDDPDANPPYVDADNPDVHSVLDADRVHQIRGAQGDKGGGVQLPSIIWRYEDDDHETTIDGTSDPILRYFNISCRADTAQAAFVLANDVLERIESRLVEKLADYDEEDYRDQQRGQYFAHILEVGISE